LVLFRNSNIDRIGVAKALNNHMLPTECPNCRQLVTEREKSSSFDDSLLESA
jgi:hypothetical protein